jgi:hypothetical protein
METTAMIRVEQPLTRTEFKAIVRQVKSGAIVNLGTWRVERVSGDDAEWSYMVTAPCGEAWWFPVAQEALHVVCEMTGGDGLNAI